ncbi:PLP-dependent aminotransferase family protein [Permianibacter sp. IMCC34836]|uniref:MocR-like pyridoxine biosynthesis transcription factor PdxR n=1 Tax=Permianibacter fluminis TaxID=2738515 RepID=UPI0015538BAA|nr:PLP-dependent aminotransferase family protein [Permianibacter fluminis]NQD36257.1 PLP-dependent aminotransferase family protein [Permianibacter fluminis]
MRAPLLEEWLAARLDRTNELPLQGQLYRGLREAILAGQLKAGDQLPSTRALAPLLAVARNTVLAAYEQLQAEGYVESRHGAGSFVAAHLPERFIETAAPSADKKAATADIELSRRCVDWLQACELPPRRNAGAFVPAMPDLRGFPFDDFWRLLHKHQRAAPWHWFDYGAGGGLPALREAIANHLQVARAVRCTAEQVIVTSSTQNSLDLCLRILADVGDALVQEEPGYHGARASAIAAGLQMVPVAVDEDGLRTDDLPAVSAQTAAPKLIYITPSHQYPLGSVMSLPRRQALLAYAARHGSYILEDDYDSEIRFNGRPLASLQGLDEHERVLYLGTFSKVLYPALRIAYIVVPTALVPAFRRSQERLQGVGNYPTQAALAEFISTGKLASHIRKMRVQYAERNALLQQLLAPYLGADWQLLGGDAGLHFVLQARCAFDDVALANAADARGIMMRPLSPYYVGADKQYGFMLGYAAADSHELKRGIAVLRSLLGWK